MNKTKEVKKLLVKNYGWKNVSVRTEKMSDGVWLYIKVKGQPEDKDLATLKIKELIRQNCEIEPLKRKSDAGWDVIFEPLTIEVEPIGYRLAKSREVKEEINRGEFAGFVNTLSGFHRVKRINVDWSCVCGNDKEVVFSGTPFDPIFVRPIERRQS